MDVRTSPQPSMQQEQQPSPQSQSIITSNSLFSLTLTRRLSIRDWTRKKSPPGSKMENAALLPQVQTDNAARSLSAPLAHLCPCLLRF
ncbi:hypothetical protein PBY51_010957 [Eleginops maclovinus]|uniref:Uncharacterized protein n=1 Tax=Eleginops maclovinus TaxID=56733 RepID=A0AAN7XA42_ELEMC|nr:hypothetical protein PBY51_010957 [Eleginops maclovinus]